MKTFKTLTLIAFLSVFSQAAFAKTVNLACAVRDSRFEETTGLKQLLIDDIYSADPYSNFPDTQKHGETIITDDYITMAFSNEKNNYYTFTLDRAEVDQLLNTDGGQVVAEIRFTNEKTKPYEKYLRDGQMLKMLSNCFLAVMD